jgi:glutamine---fructose-6-phosphate transaminase (isomerizing)
MTESGAYSLQEISTQGVAWADALEAVRADRQALVSLVERRRSDGLVFIGCGSTHYLAQFSAPYTQAVTGLRCRGVPSSELYFQTDTLLAPDERPLVVALSRSGETSETIMAVEKARSMGCEALTITCYGDSALAKASTRVVEVAEGREESYAQTRSFAGMLVAVQALAASVADDGALLGELGQLPGLADNVIERARAMASTFGCEGGCARTTFLGSGPLFGLASEATVKMKEMSLSVAEPYHFMEFRHGPMSLVDGEHLVVALVSDRMRAFELGVLRDLKVRGTRLLAIDETCGELEGLVEAGLPLHSGLSEAARPVLYLPPLQYLAYCRAMSKGLNPDRPRNVVMAIRLEGTRLGS